MVYDGIGGGDVVRRVFGTKGLGADDSGDRFCGRELTALTSN